MKIVTIQPKFYFCGHFTHKCYKYLVLFENSGLKWYKGSAKWSQTKALCQWIHNKKNVKNEIWEWWQHSYKFDIRSLLFTKGSVLRRRIYSTFRNFLKFKCSTTKLTTWKEGFYFYFILLCTFNICYLIFFVKL